MSGTVGQAGGAVTLGARKIIFLQFPKTSYLPPPLYVVISSLLAGSDLPCLFPSPATKAAFFTHAACTSEMAHPCSCGCWWQEKSSPSAGPSQVHPPVGVYSKVHACGWRNLLHAEDIHAERKQRGFIANKVFLTTTKFWGILFINAFHMTPQMKL